MNTHYIAGFPRLICVPLKIVICILLRGFLKQLPYTQELRNEDECFLKLSQYETN